MMPHTHTGINFVELMENFHKENRLLSNKLLSKHREQLALFGSAAAALYGIATCAYSCRGGDHIFEHLAGRAFNLSAAAFSLVRQGYYDEALNLVRSLGELANLQCLFWHDPGQFRAWATANRKERLKRFGPAAIRKVLEDARAIILMDRDTYADLCELATHVTPATHPNMHNDDKRATVGGVHQSNGLNLCLEHLVNMTFSIAIGFAKMLDLTELFKQLTREVSEDNSDKS